MKKLLFSVTAFMFATAIFAQKKADDVAKLNIDTYDLGKVKQSVPATATFIVTNIGKDPLIMTATPTCGCTISDYTKSPIPPGQTGFIKATYNAATLGAIHKTLTVKFEGTDDIKYINLAGEVLEPAAYDTWAAANKKADDTKTTVKTADDKTKTEVKTASTTTITKSKHKKGKKVVDKTTVKS